MFIGERLRLIREEKKLSQGDVETRTGMRRSYISRVENGHTIPSVETLIKFANGLDVPVYRLFYEGEKPAKPPVFPERPTGGFARGRAAQENRLLHKFRGLFARLDESDRQLLLSMARKMAKH